MPIIYTDKTGIGVNTSRTGVQAATGAGGGTPILLADLVAGWALATNGNQTLSSAGVIASGALDLGSFGDTSFSGGYLVSTAGGGLFVINAAIEADDTEPFLWMIEEFLVTQGAPNCVGSSSANCNPYNVYEAAGRYIFNRQYDTGEGIDDVECQLATGVPTGSTYFPVAFFDPVTDLMYIKLLNNGQEATVSTAGYTFINGETELDFNVSAKSRLRRARFWRGDNARTIYQNHLTWLYNTGSGRTDQEIAEYMGE